MSPSRFVLLACIVPIMFTFVGCSSNSTTNPEDDDSIEVDLSTFPESGDPVPNRTILTDQWASIGIIFDAAPPEVDLVVEYFGGDTAHIFFSPDQRNVTAVFRFVNPGTDDEVDAAAFSIDPWFSPGESAELVGVAEDGTVLVTDTVTPTDVGSESKTITMSIRGSFRRVEWRTHGNPGIAAHTLVFEF